MKHSLSLILTATTLLLTSAVHAGEGAPLPNPFFAMDTAGGDLKMLKELGYAGTNGTLNHNAGAVAERAAEVEKQGLKFVALYVGCTLTREGLQSDPALPEAIAALKGHDTVIWLHTDSRDFKPSSPEGDVVAIPGFAKIADLAAAANLRVAIYPHKGNWTERVQDGVRISKQVAHPNFGVCFNLCHCLAVGDGDKIPELLTEAKPYLFLVTINGADANGKGWGQLIQPLGRGTFDLVPILRTLRDLGYQGPIGFQGFGIKGDRRELLTQTMNGWRKLSDAAGKP